MNELVSRQRVNATSVTFSSTLSLFFGSLFRVETSTTDTTSLIQKRSVDDVYQTKEGNRTVDERRIQMHVRASQPEEERERNMSENSNHAVKRFLDTFVNDQHSVHALFYCVACRRDDERRKLELAP